MNAEKSEIDWNGAVAEAHGKHDIVERTCTKRFIRVIRDHPRQSAPKRTLGSIRWLY
jgi:hypothetical protein